MLVLKNIYSTVVEHRLFLKHSKHGQESKVLKVMQLAPNAVTPPDFL